MYSIFPNLKNYHRGWTAPHRILMTTQMDFPAIHVLENYQLFWRLAPSSSIINCNPIRFVWPAKPENKVKSTNPSRQTDSQ